MTYETILVDTKGAVGIITLNRPQVLNALSRTLVTELGKALDTFEKDSHIRVVVLIGSDKAFAAGADITEMKDLSYAQVYQNDFVALWEVVASCRKPIIAAVAGYALGGGCEIAMMCDIILAADNAQFGHPEITLGTIPGGGGTQRLTRTIGKSKTMELCLTGQFLSAEEAEKTGLVSRVVPLKKLMDEAMILAEKIASFSEPVIMMIKEAVNAAYETTLKEGIHLERRLFHSTFALEDRAEGMHAFLEKRPPRFKHR